jgi:hypothetical protein
MDLPLHGGAAPGWLVGRMKKLARAISDVLISEYGHDELLSRLANPYWFQALSCVLAFDWHSSGTTTVVCGVLKSVLDPGDHGVGVAGGKGARSRRAPLDIGRIGEYFSFTSSRTESLTRASRLSAKVDTSMVQDGYDIYHHAMFVSESGNWVVIQQGLNAGAGKARRYHWSSQQLEVFVEEPHSGIACDARHEGVLNLTSRHSSSCRDRSLEIAAGGSDRLREEVAGVRWGPQRSLLEWSGQTLPTAGALPPRVNWKAMDRIYDFEPRNYGDMLLVRGVGPSIVRALSLISDLVYGEPPSWRDPVKYSYCLGGKDGVPYPVDRESYDESIEILRNAVGDAKLGDRERMGALRRLGKLVPGEIRYSRPGWYRGEVDARRTLNPIP